MGLPSDVVWQAALAAIRKVLTTYSSAAATYINRSDEVEHFRHRVFNSEFNDARSLGSLLLQMFKRKSVRGLECRQSSGWCIKECCAAVVGTQGNCVQMSL